MTTKAEVAVRRAKLTNSYQALLDEFSSAPHLHTVGNYTLSHQIGSGSFGQVYLARHQLTNGTKVVLKSTSRDDPNLAREIHHHRQFSHPHIARLYEVVVTESKVWLVLEFCPGDELYRYLVQHGKGHGLQVTEVQKIFAQLVGAVSYIHGKNCVHRDLKLENVLLSKKGEVKLVDFGFTREYEGKTNYLSTFCGTVCYSAPEMLKGEKYAGEKVDVWSLGIILFALLVGQLPWDDDDDQVTKQRIIKEDPIFPDGFNDQARSLIMKLLAKRPLHRPSLAEVLNDPFLIDYAPHQQAVLKLTQPAPFTTDVEKTTLERMKAAGVDIDKVIENVLSQRCDALAGWWTLLIEKEQRKEAKRELRRREKEAEAKILRRLSGASSRLERIAPTLEDVAEEGGVAVLSPSSASSRPRSISRGRQNRRSTPQILVSDLPRLPEGSAIDSPVDEKARPQSRDLMSTRTSRSLSRPAPKERPENRRRRSSNLQLVINTSDMVRPAPQTVKRMSRDVQTKQNFRTTIAAFKHWFTTSTKRHTSPGQRNNLPNDSVTNTNNYATHAPEHNNTDTIRAGDFHTVSDTTNTYGLMLTPTVSQVSQPRPRPSHRARGSRGSLSPSPITPRSSFRRKSHGLRGRKSTSSSVSSIRSLHHYTTSHSKASSVSSENDNSTIQSPRSTSAARSPHPSVKLLPQTPAHRSLSSNLRFSRGVSNLEALNESPRPSVSQGSPGLSFAKRRRTPFKGPMLSSTAVSEDSGAGALPSPALFASSHINRNRNTSANTFNAALLDSATSRITRPKAQKNEALAITEEDEDEEEQSVAQAIAQIDIDETSESAIDDDDADSIEEVDHFGPVHLKHGESVQSISFYDDTNNPPTSGLGSGFHTPAQELNKQIGQSPGPTEHNSPITNPYNMSEHINRAFSTSTPTITLNRDFTRSKTPDQSRESQETNQSGTSTSTSGTVQRTPLRQRSDSETNKSQIIPSKASARSEAVRPEIPVRSASKNDLSHILRKSTSAKGLGLSTSGATFYAAAIARESPS